MFLRRILLSSNTTRVKRSSLYSHIVHTFFRNKCSKNTNLCFKNTYFLINEAISSFGFTFRFYVRSQSRLHHCFSSYLPSLSKNYDKQNYFRSIYCKKKFPSMLVVHNYPRIKKKDKKTGILQQKKCKTILQEGDNYISSLRC